MKKELQIFKCKICGFDFEDIYIKYANAVLCPRCLNYSGKNITIFRDVKVNWGGLTSSEPDLKENLLRKKKQYENKGF